jgi:competence ComEA-like helix-hairpin-helix protein
MNLNPENYVKQVISFQKTTFENSFAAVDMLQGQAEQIVTSAWHQAPWLPQEGKLLIDHWVGALREGRKSFRQSVREGFDRLEENLTKDVIGGAQKAARKLNAAAKEQLEEVVGIGEATAEKIVSYLEKNGPFKNWEELQKNIGISAAALSRLQKEFTL